MKFFPSFLPKHLFHVAAITVSFPGIALAQDSANAQGDRNVSIGIGLQTRLIFTAMSGSQQASPRNTRAAMIWRLW